MPDDARWTFPAPLYTRLCLAAEVVCHPSFLTLPTVQQDALLLDVAQAVMALHTALETRPKD